MLKILNKAKKRKQLAHDLLTQATERARAPVFYANLAVPDTMDGRFDLVVLHGWLVLERLKAAGLDAEAQTFTDALFTAFDEALREQGVSDMGMSRRIRAMGEAFFGRLKAYSEAGEPGALAAALARNVWRENPTEQAGRLAAYVESARAALAASDIAAGQLDFGPLP